MRSGSIRVDLNAGVDGSGVMAYALSHELTHFAEEFSAEKFRTFTDILFAEMESKGVNVQNLIESKKLDAPKGYTGEKLNEWAYSEAVAEMCETMLTDTDALTRISQKLHAKDAKLWARIKDFLQGLVERLKAAYKGLEPDSDIAKVAKEAITSSEKVLEAYADAVADAAENYRNGGRNVETGSGFASDVLNSTREKTQKQITAQYQADVDSILNMQNTAPAQLIVGYTPSLFEKMGMPSLPLTIGTGHVYSSAKTESEAKQDGNYHKGMHYHGLGAYAVKNIYSAVSDPIMIIASKDVGKNTTQMRSTHSVVAIVDIGTAQKPVVVPVEITAERIVNGARMDVNTISSIYDRSVGNLVSEAIALENIGDTGIFYAKKEALTLPGAGVQFPIRLQQSIASSDGILADFSEKVNMNISSATESQQFKRWFGDWQNNPKNASKVVNEDGTPKVVYHGTDAEFTEFKRGDVGYHVGTEAQAEDRVSDLEGQTRIMPLYASIKNPLYAAFDFGDWHGNNTAGMLIETEQFEDNPNREAIENRLSEIAQMKDVDASDKALRRYLQSLGYDGIMYDNGFEGEGISYIAFESNQLKSATDNIGTYNGKNNDTLYSSRKSNFVEDKYFSRQIDNLDNLKEGGYVTVGKVVKGSPLNQIGIQEGNVYFDVSKIRQEMQERGDPISASNIKQIPKLLDNPIAITEYFDKNGTPAANVYGELYIGSSPVVVGVMISKRRNGAAITKVQTIHAKRNFQNDVTSDNVLYLNENKKETKRWFKALSAQMPLSGEQRFGFIRKLSQSGAEVNGQILQSSRKPNPEAYDAEEWGDGRYMPTGWDEDTNVLQPNAEASGDIDLEDTSDLPFFFGDEETKATSRKTKNGKTQEEKLDEIKKAQKAARKIRKQADYLQRVLRIQKSGNLEVKAAAKELIQANRVNGDVNELSSLLQRFYQKMQRGKGEDGEAYTQADMEADLNEIADWIEDREVIELDASAEEALDYLRGKKIKLNKQELGNIKHEFGSLREFKKRHSG
jgi:hypothetical protein